MKNSHTPPARYHWWKKSFLNHLQLRASPVFCFVIIFATKTVIKSGLDSNTKTLFAVIFIDHKKSNFAIVIKRQCWFNDTIWKCFQIPYLCRQSRKKLKTIKFLILTTHGCPGSMHSQPPIMNVNEPDVITLWPCLGVLRFPTSDHWSFLYLKMFEILPALVWLKTVQPPKM